MGSECYWNFKTLADSGITPLPSPEAEFKVNEAFLAKGDLCQLQVDFVERVQPQHSLRYHPPQEFSFLDTYYFAQETSQVFFAKQELAVDSWAHKHSRYHHSSSKIPLE